MKAVEHTALVATLLFWAGSVACVPAESRENPYEPIVLRNPFGIKPPPPPAAEVPIAPSVPLPKVVLKGVTSMFGPPRALFEVTEQETGKTANVSRPILREGEREGSIEVISIDLVKNEVRIKNGTIETNVVFEVAKATGPAAPVPGAMPPTQLGIPGNPTPFINSGVPGGATAGLPGSTVLGGDGTGRPGSGVTTYGAGDKTLPTRQIRTDGVTGTSPTGADLLRDAARARGLPLPPIPAPRTTPTK
jgi:hypothetical protein